MRDPKIWLVVWAVVLATGCGTSTSRPSPTVTKPKIAIYAPYDCLRPNPGQRRKLHLRHELHYLYEHCRGRFDARRLLGLGVGRATVQVRRLGITLREVNVDGKRLEVTADLHPNRIDVAVAAG